MKHYYGFLINLLFLKTSSFFITIAFYLYIRIAIAKCLMKVQKLMPALPVKVLKLLHTCFFMLC